MWFRHDGDDSSSSSWLLRNEASWQAAFEPTRRSAIQQQPQRPWSRSALPSSLRDTDWKDHRQGTHYFFQVLERNVDVWGHRRTGTQVPVEFSIQLFLNFPVSTVLPCEALGYDHTVFTGFVDHERSREASWVFLLVLYRDRDASSFFVILLHPTLSD